MFELTDDPFYELIKLYNRCVIDYCIIEDGIPYQEYRSHKDAVLFAMCKIIERYISYQLKAEIQFGNIDEEPFPWNFDIGKAKAKLINSESFLDVSMHIHKDCYIKSQYNCETPNDRREQISYWHAFSETPHGTGYDSDDFNKINEILFPNGIEPLEIYEWSTDWSNYFDAGNEWWGTACWSIYDKSLNRYVVIMASETD